MPTDLAVAIGRRRAERFFVVRDELLLIVGAAMVGVVSALLAMQSPAFACAFNLAGLR
ncbi:MAG TPA: hypothetical protein VGV41_10985 [Pseudolabrys sp.]|uniref:hypothetical protein n=1 Tax=Pseudolabrys sp. TaxID=1960880 RepID=UPI002DDD158B|nr:hypothetical protein [Pseudolabrys sp.]HEV2629159.1 hypothetical protein [Pseudolabrys sp.]